jgi:CBS domain-containing protein
MSAMSLLDERPAATVRESALVPRDLLTTLPTLHATDGTGKALRLFVEANCGVLPVVDGEQLQGVLVESDVLERLEERDVLVMQLMRTPVHVAQADEPLARAMPLFEQRGLRAVPVLDANDVYQGMLMRASVMAALTSNLRPAKIGGMATPLGVFLTTGDVTAGVGNLGLVMTGVTLALVNWTIQLALLHGQRALGLHLPEAGQALAALAIFLVLLRLSPLAGYHAAEHQTVNAIERGEPLELDVIAAMPREHPRCGTNLMALLFGVQLLLPLIAHEPLLTLPVVVVGALAWRRVGFYLQKFFTTKPARRRQLLNGRRAGEQLLAAHAARPGFRSGRWQRLWNMGLVQILAGAFGVIVIMEAVYQLVPASRGVLF